VIYARHSAADGDDLEVMPELLAFDTSSEEHDENWMVSYADLISTLLAMVVLLFGRVALTSETPPGPVLEPITVTAAMKPGDELKQLPPIPEVVPQLAREVEPEVVPEPAAEPSPEDRLAALVSARFAGQIQAERRSEGLVLTIPEVALFDSARATLHESAMPLLDELAATLREAGDAQISVEGHTDDRRVTGGEFRSNWDLAAARANAVTQYLLGQGFDPQRVHSVSYADTHPVADNETVEGRAANRRVELAVEFARSESHS
jgi:chemotaxis protein MotB